MRSFEQSYSSSPVLVLPPTQPSFTSPFTNGVNGLPPLSSKISPTASALPSGAGRKRSRDDAAANLEEDYLPVQTPIIEAEPENEDEWEYGEGMTLIKPSTGYVTEAESQTGTWAEEKAEEEKARAARQSSRSPERPILRAAKSQRLDLTAAPSIVEEELNSCIMVAASSPERSNGFVEPTVDDFTRHLGIGWSSISADEDIQAAARGWMRFIDNHYPVSDAKIRLSSKGLASFLVEANEGYFLFGEDLKQGRLVSTSLEKTWDNLRGPVPIFDGETVMEAVATPKPTAVTQPMIDGGHAVMNGIDLNGVQPASDQTVEVEMDMS